MVFYAYHGWYASERTLGSKYVLNLEIVTTFDLAAQTDDLSLTVNYEKLYQVVNEQMRRSSKLLEHLAQRIVNAILTIFPTITAIQVEIKKLNPPLGGICHAATIIYSKER